MATEMETQSGRCATHGVVEGFRMVPKMTFPPLFTMYRRSRARRQPFRCPECNQPVTPE
jgi:hypothetical protein